LAGSDRNNFARSLREKVHNEEEYSQHQNNCKPFVLRADMYLSWYVNNADVKIKNQKSKREEKREKRSGITPAIELFFRQIFFVR
jgi:uncharacterized protein YneR